MILGGTYKTPVQAGLLDKDFVQQLRLQGTFNEDSFNRQYMSVWTGDVDKAFFSSEKFDKHRVVLLPENEKSNKAGKDTYYVFGVDVGRTECTTEVAVLKVSPQLQGPAIKTLVNIVTFEAEHFQQQCINIKHLYYKYLPKMIAVDSNGLGIGLIDYLVKQQETPDGEILPPFGVWNTDEYPEYKKYKTPQTIEDKIFMIKAHAPQNTQMYSYTQTQMYAGKIRFLIDEALAKTKLMSTKQGQVMTIDERNEYLRPFILTSILKQQMMNLVEDNQGQNIILKQSNRHIKKDKFSALIYGLYYVKKDQALGRKKKSRDLSGLLLYSSAK